MARLNDKVTIAQEKLYLTYGMLLFGDLDWPLNASHGFVSISWASCYSWLRLRRMACPPTVQCGQSTRQINHVLRSVTLC